MTMTYNWNWAIEQYNNDLNKDYLFFWGHQQAKNGILQKSCFSQWYPSVFEVEGITYKNCEQWMMAHKALLFNDHDILTKILNTSDPAIIKKMGRAVSNFNPDVWEKAKFEIVVKGNFHKFSQNESFKKFLLATKNSILVEGSPYDKIWGIGLLENNPAANNPNTWEGSNLLGFALMEVRDLIRQKKVF